MRYVTAKELRLHTRQILEQARDGEQVAVTFRGKPIALLVPFDEGAELSARAYEEAWGEIEVALARSRSPFRTAEEALRATRRRP
jgi:prevent-host-death family protein